MASSAEVAIAISPVLEEMLIAVTWLSSSVFLQSWICHDSPLKTAAPLLSVPTQIRPCRSSARQVKLTVSGIPVEYFRLRQGPA